VAATETFATGETSHRCLDFSHAFDFDTALWTKVEKPFGMGATR
jgi:hypothetical protein